MSHEISFNGINNVVFLKLLLCDQMKCSKEELDFKIVTSFSLEHRNLLKINCLWPLCNLKKLNLSSNSIKRIENLDSLTQLEDLDLSFNKISKIENLHELTKLRRISLYANCIEVLENMENLKALKILNVGSNCIRDQTCPFYIAQFKNLRCLVLSENPCYVEPDNEIDDYLLALMPQLMDLNNRKVTEKDRYLATTRYKMKTKGLKKFGIGKMDVLKSKQRKKLGRPIVSVGEKLYRKLFADYNCFLDLVEEGEAFKTVNQKFENRMISLLQEACASGDNLKKKFEYHARVLEDFEAESIEAQKRFIRDVGDCLHSEENNKRRIVKNFRKSFLAEECDIQDRFEKLFNDLENKLRAESALQIENLDDVFGRLKNEIEAYTETIFKLIASYFCKTENSMKSGFNWGTLDLEEFKLTFQEHCENFICDLYISIMKELVDWEKQFTGMFQNNLVRHRKAVGKIIKAVAAMNVDD